MYRKPCLVLSVIMVLATAGCGSNDSDGGEGDGEPGFPVQEGLAGYWAFDGDAQDLSGNDNHGSVYGAESVSDRLDRQAHAYRLDGTDDYIDMGNAATLKPVFPLTVTAWVNLTEEGGGLLSTNFHDTQYHGVFITDNPAVSKFFFNYGDGGGIGSQFRRSMALPEPPRNIWLHIASVVDTEGSLTMYVNGEPVQTEKNGTGGDMAYDDGPFNVGRVDGAPDGPAYYFNGMIDDLALFVRALSADEILEIYRYEGK